MRKLKVAGIIVAVAMLAGFVFAAVDRCDEALNMLLEGNKRCSVGTPIPKVLDEAQRKDLVKGQQPFAVIVGCSDSRVAPEYIFDQGLGQIFVVRLAGNVVDTIAMGSIEYAVEHLHAPLVIVLGHEKCGAVTAALEAKGKPEGNIGAILKKIMPAATFAKKKGGTPDEVLQTAIRANAVNTSKEIMKKSKIIRHLAHEGKVKVVAAEYSIASGKVELIEM